MHNSAQVAGVIGLAVLSALLCALGLLAWLIFRQILFKGRKAVKYEELGKGMVRRSERRVLGLFIDGTGLDRAARRLQKKVDLTSLVKGVTSGIVPTVCRYYTLIPYEDDSRQRAFLDAVERAGLSVIVKRLPPKGVTRQVSVEIEMASDIIAFALGHLKFSDLSQYKSEEVAHRGSALPTAAPYLDLANAKAKDSTAKDATNGAAAKESSIKIQRIATIVCPGRDLNYPISLAKELGVDTVTADFGQFTTGDILKSAAKWIDLSDSETIWR